MAYSFASDNAVVVHPKIMAALSAVNEGTASPYGADDVSQRLNAVYSEVFEHETFVFPVSSGTAANGLAIGGVTPSHGAIFCHEAAHIVVSEAGAPEFYTGGGRLVLLPGAHCKLTPSVLQSALSNYGPKFIQQMLAATLSVTQATERGTVYSLDELRALSRIACAAGMKVHLDGARFANALVHLGVTPAEMTWKSGIDVVAFGTTKNGTMMSEAVIVFDKAVSEVMRFKHKRAGFLHSKMRYFSAQLLAYVADGLWLETAGTANANARRISKAFAATPGVTLASPVEVNQIFVHMPQAAHQALKAAGIDIRAWSSETGDLYRLVTSYCDSEALMVQLESALSGMGEAKKRKSA